VPLDPPTLAELMRRLDEMAVRQEKILEEIKQDRATMASTYVRQDVYMAERQMANAVAADIRTDVTQLENTMVREFREIDDTRKAEQAQRRQMLMWLGGLTVTILLTIAGFIVSITTVLL